MTVVEIYKIEMPGYNTQYFTSADSDLVRSGQIYTAIPGLSREQRILSADSRQEQSVTLSMPIDVEFARLFQQNPPATVPDILISRGIRSDTSNIISSVVDILHGTISSFGQRGRVATFELSLSINDINQIGPRGIYSGNCRHRLYGEGCGLDISDFITAGTIQSLDLENKRITVQSAEDTTGFAGGVFRIDENSEAILITRQVSKAAVGANFDYVVELNALTKNIIDLAVNDPVQIILGCDFRIETCNEKFNNVANFGGFPALRSVGRAPFFDGWRR